MSVTFPNVPNAPGVPQVARAFLPTPSSVTVALEGGVLSSLFGLISTQSQWGVFDSSGNLVFEPDSFLDFECHPKSDIADFPVQGSNGTPTSFASYNKVVLPWDSRIRMSKGSTLTDRQQFLKSIKTAFSSVGLYTIITPEETYQYCDILNYDIVRSSEGDRATGAYFLAEIDVYFKQILSVQAQYSTTALQNAQSPSALPQSKTGAVLPGFASGALANQAAAASLSGAYGAF